MRKGRPAVSAECADGVGGVDNGASLPRYLVLVLCAPLERGLAESDRTRQGPTLANVALPGPTSELPNRITGRDGRRNFPVQKGKNGGNARLGAVTLTDPCFPSH
jgi:hypothetical protein